MAHQVKELKSFMAEVDEAEFLNGIGEEYPHLLVNGKDGSRFMRMNMTDGRKVILPYGRVVPEPTEIKTDVASFFPGGRKIPTSILYQTVDFFRELCRAKKTDLEAFVHILHHPTEGYVIHVPKQAVGAASVTYKWEVLPGYAIIADIHSHNSMSAFFSGTDDADDKKKVGISGVIGNINLDSGSFSSSWRFCTGTEQFISMDIADVFESMHNPEWINQIEERASGNFFGTARSLPIRGFGDDYPSIKDYSDLYDSQVGGGGHNRFGLGEAANPQVSYRKTHTERFFPNKKRGREVGLVDVLGQRLEEAQITKSNRRRRK